MTTQPGTASIALSSGQSRQRDLQTMLQDRQREMHHELRRRVRHAPSDGPTDVLDETEHAEADVQEHIDVALIQMRAETLDRIREALSRLDAGEYGYCADCEEEISENRLRALPFAVRCRDCEDLREQQAARERRAASSPGFRSVFSEHVST